MQDPVEPRRGAPEPRSRQSDGPAPDAQELRRRAAAGDADALIELFLRASRGDEAALTALVCVAVGTADPAAEARLVEWARNYLRDFARRIRLAPSEDASELAQSCAGRLLEHLRDIRGRDARAFIAYLERMARRWQIDAVRRRNSRREIPFGDATEAAALRSREPSPDERAGDSVESLLAALPEPDRTIVFRKHVEGTTYGEIGRAFDPPWSEDRVRMRAARALRQLGRRRS